MILAPHPLLVQSNLCARVQRPFLQDVEGPLHRGCPKECPKECLKGCIKECHRECHKGCPRVCRRKGCQWAEEVRRHKDTLMVDHVLLPGMVVRRRRATPRAQVRVILALVPVKGGRHPRAHTPARDAVRRLNNRPPAASKQFALLDSDRTLLLR